MKTYLVATCVLFALIVLAHLMRIMTEGSRLLTDPWYVLVTAAAAALSVWAWRLLRISSRS